MHLLLAVAFVRGVSHGGVMPFAFQPKVSAQADVYTEQKVRIANINSSFMASVLEASHC